MPIRVAHHLWEDNKSPYLSLNRVFSKAFVTIAMDVIDTGVAFK